LSFRRVSAAAEPGKRTAYEVQSCGAVCESRIFVGRFFYPLQNEILAFSFIL